MFTNKRYMTKRVANELPPELIFFIWERIDQLRLESKDEIDYLQVFDLSAINQSDVYENQLIVHRSEKPSYKMSYAATVSKPINAKLYAIDSGAESTLLFSEEY